MQGFKSVGSAKDFCQFTPPFTTPSMFNTISFLHRRNACFEVRQWRHGLRRLRLHKLDEQHHMLWSELDNVTKPQKPIRLAVSSEYIICIDRTTVS